MRGNGGDVLEGGLSSTAVAAPVVAPATVEDAVRRLADEPDPAANRRQAGPGRARIKGRGWLMRRALAVADIVALTLAFGLSLKVFAGHGPANEVSDAVELGIFALSMPFWLLVAKIYGLYRSDEERTDHSTADDIVGVFHLVTVGSWLLFILVTATGFANPSIFRIISFWVLAIVLVTSFRGIARTIVRHSGAFKQNTVIVGAGTVGQLLARKILQHPEYGIHVVGFVDSDPREREEGLGTLTILGSPDDLPRLVRELRIQRVIVAFSNEPHPGMLDLIRRLDELDIRIDIVPRLFEVLGTEIGVHSVEGVPLIGLPAGRLGRSSLLLKRAFDVTFASLVLVVLSPLLVTVAVLIKLDSRGPVFFRQTRMGSGERVFDIYKFRTMHIDADERKAEVAHLNKHRSGDPRMFKIPNDPRVTRVGAFLRRYSLDELPQLINVVRGEMSIVGPRPLILEEDRFVVDWRRRRLHLKPGITGLWQVLGRDGIPFEEMVKLDYLYVSTWSVFSDVKLIVRTIPVIFRSNPC